MNNLLSLAIGIVFMMIMFASCNHQAKEDYPAWHNPAVEHLTEAIRQAPNNAELYFERSQILFQINAVELAQKDIQHAISLDSNNLQYLFALSKVNLVLENPDEALKNLERLMTKTNNQEPALLLSAHAYLMKKDFEQAQSILENILQEDAHHPEALFQLAQIYLAQKQELSAIDLLERIAEKNPNHYNALYLLADCYVEIENEKAVEAYQKVFRLDTLDVSPLVETGRYYESKNEINKAKDFYYQALLRDPGFSPVLVDIGKLLMQEDSLDKALRQFSIAIQTAPNSAEAYYQKGLCFEKLKQKDSAAVAFKQALVFASDDSEIIEALKRTQ